MEIDVRVMNGDDRRIDLDPSGRPPTYGDVLDAVGFNREAAVVLVDGRPVPDDAEVGTSSVTVMHTVSGGAESATEPPC